MSNHISTLTLALSSFAELDVRAITVGKGNPAYYQVFYRKDGSNRVMLVPKRVSDFETLQRDVRVLLSRNSQQQIDQGFKDGPNAN